jgi:hypothetical protein
VYNSVEYILNAVNYEVKKIVKIFHNIYGTYITIKMEFNVNIKFKFQDIDIY